MLGLVQYIQDKRYENPLPVDFFEVVERAFIQGKFVNDTAGNIEELHENERDDALKALNEALIV
jgi:hypothetical protein